MPPHDHLLIFLLFLYSLLPSLPALAQPHAKSASLPNSSPSPHIPLLLLSTMDGTVSAFHAHTGDLVFSHRDSHPAVDSWAAPGLPEYVPSLDGHLYRIDRTTDDATLIDDTFISVPFASDALPQSFKPSPAEQDAIIYTSKQSSAVYVDLKKGRVVRHVTFQDAGDKQGQAINGLFGDGVVVISRTNVGVKVVDLKSGRLLANASLTHTVPRFVDGGKCDIGSGEGEGYVAVVANARDHITVKSGKTGKTLWSKKITTPVVEAHGMGGVSISGVMGGTDEMIDGGEMELVVGRDNGYMYARLGDGEGDDANQKVIGDGNEDRFKVNFGERGFLRPKALEMRQELRGLPKPVQRTEEHAANPNFDVTTKDLKLALLGMIIVGLAGFAVGRHPRGRARKKVKRRNAKPNSNSNGTEEDIRDDDSETDVEEEEEDVQDNNQVARPSLRTTLPTDKQHNFESSTGSSGSGGGGYASGRTQSGWLSVGSLQVSPKVLGFGSHGTVVYEGIMMPGDRKIAVKRLLRQFFESARQEISLLVQLDEASPHVVRYFAMEEDSEFIYLALELCAASLAECVTKNMPPVPSSSYRGGPPATYVTRAMRQLIQGLRDLHRAGVVHRDVKPQNVLITRKSSMSSVGDVKLADVGLALRLAANRSSYTAASNVGGGVGTTGWRAPEVLSGGRQTKAVDIFAAGCVVSFVLTGGHHPFGIPIRRDGNIANGTPELDALEALKLPEATDIVKKMIDPVASKRPNAEEALKHPFFWTDAMKLSFLVDISDRLYDTRHDPARYTENLDRYPLARQYCSDWLVTMDMELLAELGRGYDNTASGLLRVIRNKRNHYSELSASIRKRLGEIPEEKHRSPRHTNGADSSSDQDMLADGNNFLTYFTSRVPQLLMCVYKYAIDNPVLVDQPHFERYGLQPNISSEAQVPLHPFVRRARQARSDADRLPKVMEEVAFKPTPPRDTPSELIEAGTRGAITELQDESDSGLEMQNDSPVVSLSMRRVYPREEMIEVQKKCPRMHPDVQNRAMALALYQPSAFARLRKRLETNRFEDTDFDDDSHKQDTANMEVPHGFQRVLPRGRPQYEPQEYHTRNQHKYGMGSPVSRPPGFRAGPPGFAHLPRGPPGFSGNNYPPGFNHANASPPGVTGQDIGGGNAPHTRRTAHGHGHSTVSQFTGEERVVDFGALRRRNGPPR